jgi:hypothetical protein
MKPPMHADARRCTPMHADGVSRNWKCHCLLAPSKLALGLPGDRHHLLSKNPCHEHHQ